MLNLCGYVVVLKKQLLKQTFKRVYCVSELLYSYREKKLAILRLTQNQIQVFLADIEINLELPKKFLSYVQAEFFWQRRVIFTPTKTATAASQLYFLSFPSAVHNHLL